MISIISEIFKKLIKLKGQLKLKEYFSYKNKQLLKILNFNNISLTPF